MKTPGKEEVGRDSRCMRKGGSAMRLFLGLKNALLDDVPFTLPRLPVESGEEKLRKEA